MFTLFYLKDNFFNFYSEYKFNKQTEEVRVMSLEN